MAEQPTLQSAGCPLGCGGGERPLGYGGDRLHGLPGRFAVVRCQTCGLVRTEPRPAPEAMGAYYPPDYGPYRDAPAPSPAGQPSLWKRWARRLFEFNVQRLPPLSPGHLLEVGCAAGTFLARQQRAGWSAAGIEFSLVAAEKARRAGTEVYCGAVETAPEPAVRPDLVVAWMVLEHLHDPVLALRRFRTWTRPGGWLVLSTPDIRPWMWRVFGMACYDLHLPNHLYHFSRESLARMLEREGWEVRAWHHHRLLSSLAGSLGNRLQDAGRQGRWTGWLQGFPARPTRLHYLFYPLAALLAACGQTGRVTVWARRRDA